MSEMDIENKLRYLASGMEYPRTPNIAGSVTAHLRKSKHARFHSKALVWSLTIILVLCSSLMLIPSARAAILEFIQIGVVRIFPQSVETTLTAIPPSDLLSILNQMAGEMALADAQKLVDYEILIPTYPLELGLPDRVYVQNADGAMTILVWLDPQHPDKIWMSLHFIPTGSWAIDKGMPANILDTSVNGQRAIWGEGPYPLRMDNGDIQFTRLIEGHVLIWAEADVTYRLETDLPFTEAIKVAESLKPVP